MSFVFPIAGPYQWKRVDKGQDFQTKPGTPLRAVEAGILTFGRDPAGFGPRYPILKADSGRSYYYGHVDLPAGFEGKRVNAGDLIARTGAPRGNATSPGWLEFGDAGLLGHGGETGGAAIASTLHQAAGKKGGGFDPLKSAGNVGSALLKDLLPHKVDSKTDPLNTGTADVQQALASGAGDAATATAGAVVNLLWGAIGNDAMRVLLYVLFVGGGLMLGYAGVHQLTRQPEAAR